MRSSWILWKVRNSNNALSVNFGYKKIKAVIIWLASANLNFVINVEECTWSANVYKTKESRCKIEED